MPRKKYKFPWSIIGFQVSLGAKANLRYFSATAGYQCRVLNRHFEKRLLHAITHFEVEKMLLAERQREGREGKLSNRTINRVIERLNAIFTLAVAEGFVRHDPTRCD